MDLVGGDVEDGFGSVADEFRRNLEERDELGAALTVIRDGRAVVDLWGGHADPERVRPWRAHTRVPVFSTTKGMSAAAITVAHSRGLFDLNAPVATYWPEFAQNGKERITIRELLGHRAGLAVIDVPIGLDDITDHDRLGRILATQAPSWAPGTRQGYHAQSLGWYETQLLRRVDPEGRSIGRWFADEVAEPLDAEFGIGSAGDGSWEDVATFVGAGRLAALVHARQIPRPLLMAMLNPRSTTSRAFSNPRTLAMNMANINRAEVLRVEFPSMNGVGTARGIARVYGCLATGGAALGLARRTLDELEAPVIARADEVLRVESAFSFGFMKPFPLLPFGSSDRAYGHSGMGGSLGFADPAAGVGYAYVMNRAGYSMPTDPRELALRRRVYEQLD